jgi:hypothetical protein
MEQVAGIKVLDMPGAVSEHDFGDLLRRLIEPGFRRGKWKAGVSLGLPDEKRESGCTGWQVDTTRYSTETFVTGHIPN